MPGCGPTEGTLAHAAKGFNFASDRKLPDHSGQHSWLLMELQTSQGGHAGPLATAESTDHGYASIRAGPQSDRRRWPGRLCEVHTVPGCTMERKQEARVSVMLCACSGPAVLLWHVPSTRALLWTVHPLPWKWHPLIAVASFSRIMWATTEEKWFKDGRKTTKTSLGCWIGL